MFGLAYEDECTPCGGVMFAVPEVDAAADMVRRRGGSARWILPYAGSLGASTRTEIRLRFIG
jgi:hypothetical protein